MLRKVFIATGIVLLLLVAAAVTVPFLFRDRLLERVNAALNEQLDARVRIGSVGLSAFRSFPQLSLCIGDLTMTGKDVFAGDTLLHAEKIHVAISLFDVLRGDQIGIRSVQLIRPRIHVRILADGRANYNIMKEDTAAASGEPATYRVQLQSYRISNGYVVYDDASTAMYLRLHGISHQGRGDFTQSVFTLNTTSEVQDVLVRYAGVNYLNRAKLKVHAAVRVNMDSAHYTFEKNEFVINDLPLTLDGWLAMPGDDIHMDLSWALARSDFRSLISLVPAIYATNFNQLKADGQVSAAGRVWGVYGERRNPAFDIKLQVDNGQFQYENLPQAVRNVQIDLAIRNPDGVPDKTVVDLRRLHAELGGDAFDARLHVATPVSDPDINAMVKGVINLGNLKNLVSLPASTELGGIIRADVSMKGRYSSIEQKRYEQFQASGQISMENVTYRAADAPATSITRMLLEFRPELIALRGLQARAGASDFAASGTISNLLGYYFRKELLQGAFQLSAQLIDLNEFMTGSPTATRPADTAQMQVLVVPANLDFRLQLDAGRILYDRLELRQVQGSLLVREGVMNLQQLAFNTLGGAVQMSGSYATKNPQAPAINYALQLNNLDIKQTVQAIDVAAKLAPIAQHASGRFSSELSVAGTLDEHMQPVAASFSGKGVLQARQVTISNFVPLQQLADAIKMDQYKQLFLPEAQLTFYFENGRVRITPFETTWNGARSILSGTHGFDQTLDYQVQLLIPRAQLPAAAVQTFTAGMAQVQQLTGTAPQLPDPVQVNIRIGGTVSKPTISTDFRQQAQQAVQSLVEAVEQKVEQKVEAKIEEVKADVRAEANRILQQAQQQAQLIRQQAQQAADKIKKEGYAQADKLVAEAKNPIAKAAAQEAAKKLKQETDRKAQAVIDNAEREVQKILNEAQRKADELLK